MKDYVKLIIKGFIIGLGKIIPGVSGAILAMSLNVYEPALSAISNIKKDFCCNIRFLAFLGIGITFAIAFGSSILLFFLNKYYLQTMFLFIGSMISGLSSITKIASKANLSQRIISIVIVLLLLIISSITFRQDKISFSNTLMYFVSGILDSFASIVPGISGTAMLMLIGTYKYILDSFANILNINLFFNNLSLIIPFLSGTIIGAYFVSKLVNYFFEKYKIISYCCIFWLVISSTFIILSGLEINKYNAFQIVVSLLLLLVGFITTKKINI